jgi:hypothetical protein
MNSQLEHLLNLTQGRLKELENKVSQDSSELLRGQIYELTLVIIQIQRMYLEQLTGKQESVKLLCIDDRVILSSSGRYSLNGTNRVYKGKIYTGTSRGVDQDGDDVWYIEEVQTVKLASRFRAV